MNLNTQQTAASLVRATDLAHGREARFWEFLPPAVREVYLRVASLGPAELERMEGSSYAEAAAALYALGAGGQGESAFSSISLPSRLHWEVIARHLMALIDGEFDDLAEAEGLWKGWVSSRLEGAPIGAPQEVS